MAKDIKLVFCVDEESRDIEDRLFMYLNQGYTIVTTRLEPRCDRASGVFVLEKEIDNIPEYIENLRKENDENLSYIEERTAKDADWYDRAIRYSQRRISNNEEKIKILENIK